MTQRENASADHQEPLLNDPEGERLGRPPGAAAEGLGGSWGSGPRGGPSPLLPGMMAVHFLCPQKTSRKAGCRGEGRRPLGPETRSQ